MKKILLIFGLIFTTSFVQAQEDCTNGIDDDNDGLIDLWDEDCQCLSPTGYYFLDDFDNNSCCPQYFTTAGNPFGIECLNGMSAATVGTPDYFHTCGYLGGLNGPEPPLIPQPFPSGMGATGLVAQNGYSEYLGTCLPQPLQAGVEYEVSVFVGFNSNNEFGSASPLLINIYATTNCTANYPSGQIFCLDQDPNWNVIGSMIVSGNLGEWVQVSTTITPGSNVEAIAFGVPCNFVSGSNYYFFDDFQITGGGVEEIPLEDIISESGNCMTGITLASNTFPGATYQWFLNGIAIAGATNPNYPVPPGAEGSYQVMITLNGECGISNVYEVEIDEAVLQIDADVTQITCYNAGDGSIYLNLPGINEPYDIIWSNGATSQEITGLSLGIYSVTVTDSKGCYTEQVYDLFQPEELELILDYVIQPGPGNNIGEAGILVAGGTPAYKIEWSTGGNGYKETGLTPGEYTITLTDENGCQDTVSFTIAAPFQSQVSYVPSSCLSCSGSISVEIIGGTDPIAVSITNLSTGESTIGNVAGNLCPTIYAYSITDGNGNSFIDTLDLGALAFPKIKTTLLQDTVCVGDSTGAIGVNVTGGNPDYQYKWSTGDTINAVQKLKAGMYALTVTDQLGCTDTVVYQIQAAPAMITTVSASPAGCLIGGSVAQNVMGGTMPYKWLWSTGDTTAMVNDIGAGTYTVVVMDSLGCRKQDTVSVIQQGGIQAESSTGNAHCAEAADGYINLNPTSFNGFVTYQWSNGSTEEDLDSLESGVYTVTMTDEIGCRLIQQYTIGLEPAYQVSALIKENNCYSDSLASIELNILGGSSYQYTWSTGGTTNTLSALKGGYYAVTVTDDYGCEQRYDYTITDPPLLELQVSVNPLLCAGEANGGASLTATGGTGIYKYFINGIETGSDITGLGEDAYDLLVRDENGCSEAFSLVLNALSDTKIATQTTEAPCGESAGSLIDVTVSGGIAPYQYNWSNGSMTEDLRDVPAGIYEVTVTDDLGCEIIDTVQLSNTDGPQLMISGEDVICNGENNGQLMVITAQGSPPYSIYINGNLVSTGELTNLAAGIYEVAVVDAKGCEIKTSYEIAEPAAIVGEIVGVIQPDINNTTGSASIEVIGGTGPYTIEWDNGEVGEQAKALTPGLHTVTITDSRGCREEASVTIVKSAIYAIWDKQDNACAGECVGEINITIQNMDGTEKIEWSDGGTGFVRTGLCSGEYQWTITDGYGNTTTSPVVAIITPEPIRLEVEIMGESCENKGDGQATVSINGGTPDYTIKWDGVTGTETKSLSTGIHKLEIRDANGCFTDTVVLLQGLVSANISTEVKDAICETGGELTLQTSGLEIIEVLINGTKYSIDKELTIRPLPPAMYKIEQQISDSCIVFKEDVIIENETFITGGSIQTEIEVKEGDQVALDISGWQVAGEYSIKWEGVQQNNCEQTDAFGNCLKYVYVPDGPHEVSAYILSAQGCDSLVTFNIRVLADNDVFFPNVFGVGNNNVFKPSDKTGKTKIASFEIYDRWGNLVYIERVVEISALRGWDGTINGSQAEQGVYIYHLKIVDNGGKIKNKVGDVTLVK